MKLAQLPLKNQECKAVQKASLSPCISLSVSTMGSQGYCTRSQQVMAGILHKPESELTR